MSFVSTAAKTAAAGLLLVLAADASARTVIVERPHRVVVRHTHVYPRHVYPRHVYRHHRVVVRHPTVVIRR